VPIIRLVSSALLVISLAACDASGGAAASSRSAEAHRLVSEGATLLDVRTPAEFSSHHVEGALNVPVDQVGARLSEIPRERPVVVYCRSGGRSARAAEELRAAGYTVHDLGGIAAW
jgi:rhodanese-related sulfurtransferase